MHAHTVDKRSAVSSFTLVPLMVCPTDDSGGMIGFAGLLGEPPYPYLNNLVMLSNIPIN